MIGKFLTFLTELPPIRWYAGLLHTRPFDCTVPNPDFNSHMTQLQVEHGWRWEHGHCQKCREPLRAGAWVEWGKDLYCYPCDDEGWYILFG